MILVDLILKKSVITTWQIQQINLSILRQPVLLLTTLIHILQGNTHRILWKLWRKILSLKKLCWLWVLTLMKSVLKGKSNVDSRRKLNNWNLLHGCKGNSTGRLLVKTIRHLCLLLLMVRAHLQPQHLLHLL
ncbi:hypothetical protein BC941DRAFT_408046 [Chlamydoabsidia padenii]|nr:hypothetical protein BC941DRAFT_408046 [Chlamydoabsidia padenii]